MSLKNDDSFYDIYYSREIEDFRIDKIIILETAKKSFKDLKHKFTNYLETDEYEKEQNIYLNLIIKNIKNYLNLKKRSKFIDSLIEINDEYLLERINKNKRMNDLFRKANIKPDNFFHIKLITNKKTWDKENDIDNVRIIFKYENNSIYICLIDLYHLFVIEKIEKYENNFLKNQNHGVDLEDFFKKIEPKYKKWKGT